MKRSTPLISPNPTRIQVARYVLQTPLLRTIFVACLAVAMLLPFYNMIQLSQFYRHMASTYNEDEAQHLAAHLMRIMKLGKKTVSFNTVNSETKASIRQFKTDFNLDKLRLFDPLGVIVYSSTASEIGQTNSHPYFKQKVAKGRLHSKFVPKGTRTQEGQMVHRDIVEVYVPVMDGPTFLGALEIYYDFTEVGRRLSSLLLRSNLTIGMVAVTMMVVVVAILLKTGAAMISHSLMDKAINEAHDLMEHRVRERTKELIDANKDLQLEIMERRVAETNLRESEKRFRTLVETIPHGIQEIDSDGTITFANPAHAKIYGCEPRQLIGTSILELAAGEHERQQLKAHLAYLRQHKPDPHPWFGKDSTKDGRIINTQVDWNYKQDVQGRVLGLITVISDITHRKRAEKALLDNLNFMNTLIDTIPNPVFYKDNEGLFLGCNVAYAETLGLDKEKILGRRLVDLESTVSSDMAEHYHQQDLLLIRNPGVQAHEDRVLCADGRLRDFVLFNATFSDADDKVAGMVGIMLDITEQKKVEKALKESKNLFDAFMRHLPGLAFMKDSQGKYIYVNETFSQLTSIRTSGIPGKQAVDVWDPESAKTIDANDEKLFQDLNARNDMENVTLPDNRERHLLTVRFPIFQDDTLFGLGGISIDITERTIAQKQSRQLELQLQQTQKMEALGTLAGGIAHDFNNILSAIIGYTEIAASEIEKKSAIHGYLARVLASSERASSLIKQILAFSRQGDMEPKPVQVKLIIKEVLKMLRASLPATIDIVQEIHSDGAVMADPTQIHQIMMNLGTNSGYAMGRTGGKLTVHLDHITLNKVLSLRHGDLPSGDYLKLSVTDNGMGISTEHLDKIFDPFFTTKPKGEGTGLGLAVVHGIVTGLGGAIAVASTPKQGTRFDIYLPALPRKTKMEISDEKKLPTGNERILYVDDEVFQTDMFKHLLGLLGYRVEVCNSSAKALKVLEDDIQGFDLMITDMIMPEMTGDQLVQKVLSLRPGLPIILATGYSEGFTEAKAKEMGVHGFALKPLVMEDLANLVRSVLDESLNTA